jgi:hypothetical protein
MVLHLFVYRHLDYFFHLMLAKTFFFFLMQKSNVEVSLMFEVVVQ